MRTGRCSSQESRLSLICYQGHCHNGSLGGRRCCWQLFGCRDPHRQLAAVANFVLGNQTGLPQPDDPPSPSPSGDPPLGASSTSTTSVWWGEWNFRVLLSWTNLMVFSTPDRQGSLGTEGGWALYLLDKLGVISFGRYWPVAGWTALATLVIGLLTALVWSLKACEKWVCCGCGCGRRGHRDGHQLVDPALRHQPVTPAPAAYAPVTLVGPGSSTPVDTEYFQRQVRGGISSPVGAGCNSLAGDAFCPLAQPEDDDQEQEDREKPPEEEEEEKATIQAITIEEAITIEAFIRHRSRLRAIQHQMEYGDVSLQPRATQLQTDRPLPPMLSLGRSHRLGLLDRLHRLEQRGVSWTQEDVDRCRTMERFLDYLENREAHQPDAPSETPGTASKSAGVGRTALRNITGDALLYWAELYITINYNRCRAAS
ncbi:hypothetical protein AK812_SmicGene40346 [Symbiodinium microadriaticum]|uniref:Uncharacterized protein n=1 Tax=Symbiodinium microadriaticum TaxID=2951 RepID=A0A1Q9C8Z6_SYMMI|nr:hypothetical protein AK812_SmicGene40346 [Symbiodinium microadriaticum]